MEERVRHIPDLNQRVAAFLREQADYEAWRERRYSSRAREIVDESSSTAAALADEGLSREELFNRFFELHDRFTRSL